MHKIEILWLRIVTGEYFEKSETEIESCESKQEMNTHKNMILIKQLWFF